MPSSETAQVVILGDGLIGLACAFALSERDVACALVGRRRDGFASAAAAGILAPTIETASGAAFDFALAARDRFPSYVRELHESTGLLVPLAFEGILRMGETDAESEALRLEADDWSAWLAPDDVARLEPSVAAPFGARWHHGDGVVDNRRLLAALDAAISLGATRRLAAMGVRLELGATATVVTDQGERIGCDAVVLAAGAWSPDVTGLPRPLPIFPLRGQMLALQGAPTTRPVYGAGGYLVPRREGYTIVGSTSERVGFADGTTPEALERFREIARSVAPSLGGAPVRDAWSGFRPMTPDGLPVIGPDPEVPSVVYACGHSRNGILMAPLTGDAVAAIIGGEHFPLSLDPFRISRLSEQNAALA